jgi:uncharacterized protein YdeI (BOF family)
MRKVLLCCLLVQFVFSIAIAQHDIDQAAHVSWLKISEMLEKVNSKDYAMVSSFSTTGQKTGSEGSVDVYTMKDGNIVIEVSARLPEGLASREDDYWFCDAKGQLFAFREPRGKDIFVFAIHSNEIEYIYSTRFENGSFSPPVVVKISGELRGEYKTQSKQFVQIYDSMKKIIGLLK